MKLGVAEILNKIASLPTKEEKVAALWAQRDNQVLTLLLKMSFDPGLEWFIPKGTPPYTPGPVHGDQQGQLYSEMKRMSFFAKLPNSPKNITQVRREQRFIDVLEAVHPEDAKLLINVKDKKPLAKGLTRKLVEEGLPGLLQ